VAKKILFTLKVDTQKGQEMVLITDQVKELVRQANVKEGLCFLFIPHVTAALTINSYLDPDTSLDLIDEVDRVIPTRVDFKHILDTPADASAHVKASLIGTDLTLVIHEGELLLGPSQGIFFWEYDGPRNRKVMVKIIEG
jgi:secondary thiamine-phosphate synthase enzyme